MVFHSSIIFGCLLVLFSKQTSAEDNELDPKGGCTSGPVADCLELHRQISGNCINSDVYLKEISSKLDRMIEAILTPKPEVDLKGLLRNNSENCVDPNVDLRKIYSKLDLIIADVHNPNPLTDLKELLRNNSEKCCNSDVNLKQISSKLDRILEEVHNPNPVVDSEKCSNSGADLKEISSKLDRIIAEGLKDGSSGNGNDKPGKDNDEPGKDNDQSVKDYVRPGKYQARDCADHYKAGNWRSGVYFIVPEGWTAKDGFNVFCDMDTDGGGWTVFQRRGDFGNPADYFYKTWDEYKAGFGDLQKEFWLGNEQLHALTNQRTQGFSYYEFRADMKDMEDKAAFAKYKEFRVQNETMLYELHAVGYYGTAGTCLAYYHKKKFCTKDKTIEGNAENYAIKYQGGFWYWITSSLYCNPNGLNVRGKNTLPYGQSIEWYLFRSHYYSLPTIELKIRPGSF